MAWGLDILIKIDPVAVKKKDSISLLLIFLNRSFIFYIPYSFKNMASLAGSESTWVWN